MISKVLVVSMLLCNLTWSVKGDEELDSWVEIIAKRMSETEEALKRPRKGMEELIAKRTSLEAFQHPGMKELIAKRMSGTDDEIMKGIKRGTEEAFQHPGMEELIAKRMSGTDDEIMKGIKRETEEAFQHPGI